MRIVAKIASMQTGSTIDQHEIALESEMDSMLIRPLQRHSFSKDRVGHLGHDANFTGEAGE